MDDASAESKPESQEDTDPDVNEDNGDEEFISYGEATVSNAVVQDHKIDGTILLDEHPTTAVEGSVADGTIVHGMEEENVDTVDDMSSDQIERQIRHVLRRLESKDQIMVDMEKALDEEAHQTKYYQERSLELENKIKDLTRTVTLLEQELDEYEREIERKEREIQQLKEVMKSEREVYKKIQDMTAEVKRTSAREKDELMQRIVVLEAKAEKLRNDKRQRHRAKVYADKAVSTTELVDTNEERRGSGTNDSLLRNFVIVVKENDKLKAELESAKKEHEKILEEKRRELTELRADWDELYADSMVQAIEIQKAKQNDQIADCTDGLKGGSERDVSEHNSMANDAVTSAVIERLSRSLKSEQDQNDELKKKLQHALNLYDDVYDSMKSLENKTNAFSRENELLKTEMNAFIDRLEEAQTEKAALSHDLQSSIDDLTRENVSLHEQLQKSNAVSETQPDSETLQCALAKDNLSESIAPRHPIVLKVERNTCSGNDGLLRHRKKRPGSKNFPGMPGHLINPLNRNDSQVPAAQIASSSSKLVQRMVNLTKSSTDKLRKWFGKSDSSKKHEPPSQVVEMSVFNSDSNSTDEATEVDASYFDVDAISDLDTICEADEMHESCTGKLFSKHDPHIKYLGERGAIGPTISKGAIPGNSEECRITPYAVSDFIGQVREFLNLVVTQPCSTSTPYPLVNEEWKHAKATLTTDKDSKHDLRLYAYLCLIFLGVLTLSSAFYLPTALTILVEALALGIVYTAAREYNRLSNALLGLNNFRAALATYLKSVYPWEEEAFINSFFNIVTQQEHLINLQEHAIHRLKNTSQRKSGSSAYFAHSTHQQFQDKKQNHASSSHTCHPVWTLVLDAKQFFSTKKLILCSFCQFLMLDVLIFMLLTIVSSFSATLFNSLIISTVIVCGSYFAFLDSKSQNPLRQIPPRIIHMIGVMFLVSVLAHLLVTGFASPTQFMYIHILSLSIANLLLSHQDSISRALNIQSFQTESFQRERNLHNDSDEALDTLDFETCEAVLNAENAYRERPLPDSSSLTRKTDESLLRLLREQIQEKKTLENEVRISERKVQESVKLLKEAIEVIQSLELSCSSLQYANKEIRHELVQQQLKVIDVSNYLKSNNDPDWYRFFCGTLEKDQSGSKADCDVNTCESVVTSEASLSYSSSSPCVTFTDDDPSTITLKAQEVPNFTSKDETAYDYVPITPPDLVQKHLSAENSTEVDSSKDYSDSSVEFVILGADCKRNSKVNFRKKTQNLDERRIVAQSIDPAVTDPPRYSNTSSRRLKGFLKPKLKESASFQTSPSDSIELVLKKSVVIPKRRVKRSLSWGKDKPESGSASKKEKVTDSEIKHSISNEAPVAHARTSIQDFFQPINGLGAKSFDSHVQTSNSELPSAAQPYLHKQDPLSSHLDLQSKSTPSLADDGLPWPAPVVGFVQVSRRALSPDKYFQPVRDGDGWNENMLTSDNDAHGSSSSFVVEAAVVNLHLDGEEMDPKTTLLDDSGPTGTIFPENSRLEFLDDFEDIAHHRTHNGKNADYKTAVNISELNRDMQACIADDSLRGQSPDDMVWKENPSWTPSESPRRPMLPQKRNHLHCNDAKDMEVITGSPTLLHRSQMESSFEPVPVFSPDTINETSERSRVCSDINNNYSFSSGENTEESHRIAINYEELIRRLQVELDNERFIRKKMVLQYEHELQSLEATLMKKYSAIKKLLDEERKQREDARRDNSSEEQHIGLNLIFNSEKINSERTDGETSLNQEGTGNVHSLFNTSPVQQRVNPEIVIHEVENLIDLNECQEETISEKNPEENAIEEKIEVVDPEQDYQDVLNDTGSSDEFSLADSNDGGVSLTDSDLDDKKSLDQSNVQRLNSQIKQLDSELRRFIKKKTTETQETLTDIGIIEYNGLKGILNQLRSEHHRPFTIKRSSKGFGSRSDLRTFNCVPCSTSDYSNSWVRVDFHNDVSVLPRAYALRHGWMSADHCTTSWVLEGSKDGDQWFVLRKHNDDYSLQERYGEEVFDLKHVFCPYPKFRVRQTAENTSGTHELYINKLELFGTCIRSEAQ